MGQLATQVDEPVFLYELAIELDMRSIELAEDAAGLGMSGVGPTSELTRDQVAALRAACGRAPTTPVAAPPAAGPALAAPAGWGRPAGVGLRSEPVAAQPPPPAPPPPPPPLLAAAPMGVAPMPAPPAAAAPFATAGPPPPPPAPPGTGPPDAWGLLQSAQPDGPVGPPAQRSRGQLAAIGAVVLLVAGLFAYMTLNSGPDKAREEKLRAADRRATAAPTPTLAPTTTTSTAPPQTTIPYGSPRVAETFADLGRFCMAFRGVNAYELRIVASENDGDWRAIRQTILDGQVAWRQSVEEMAAGTAPYLAPDIQRYRTSYETLINGAQNATSADEMQRLFRENVNSALLQAGQQLNSAVASNCRVGQHLPSYNGGA